MSTRQRTDSIAQTRARLRQSRAEIFSLAKELRVESGPRSTQFPRSLIMQILMSQGGRAVLGGAALGLGLMRPRLLTALWRLGPLAALLRAALNRYLVRRIFR